MKITKELKSIIERRVNDKVQEKATERQNASRDLANQCNSTIVQSDEYQKLIAAAKEFDTFADNLVNANKDMLVRNPRCTTNGSLHSWLKDDVEKTGTVSARDGNAYGEYRDTVDKIIMKLTYGKDFEEAKAILAEYGIEL
jgi:hypothetical protein